MAYRTIPTPQGTEKQDNLQPVMDVIAQSPLQKLVEKARLLIALDDQLHKHLPKQFAGLCSVMNVQHGVLIIRANNASIATRLRFMADNILQGLHQSERFKSIRKVDIKVQF